MSSESNNITTAPSSTDNNQHSTTSAVLPPSVRSPVFEKPREDLTSRLQKEFGLLVEADTSNSDLDQTLDHVHDHVSEGDMLEVMLPGGEVVAATLVRHPTGKIIPLVLASHQ